VGGEAVCRSVTLQLKIEGGFEGGATFQVTMETMETLKTFEEQYECVTKFLTTWGSTSSPTHSTLRVSGGSVHLFILTEDKEFYGKFEDAEEDENPILKAITDARASVVIGGVRPYIFSRKPIYPFNGSDESSSLKTIWLIKSPADKALMDAYLTNFPEEPFQVVRFE